MPIQTPSAAAMPSKNSWQSNPAIPSSGSRAAHVSGTGDHCKVRTMGNTLPGRHSGAAVRRDQGLPEDRWRLVLQAPAPDADAGNYEERTPRKLSAVIPRSETRLSFRPRGAGLQGHGEDVRACLAARGAASGHAEVPPDRRRESRAAIRCISGHILTVVRNRENSRRTNVTG